MGGHDHNTDRTPWEQPHLPHTPTHHSHRPYGPLITSRKPREKMCKEQLQLTDDDCRREGEHAACSTATLSILAAQQQPRRRATLKPGDHLANTHKTPTLSWVWNKGDPLPAPGTSLPRVRHSPGRCLHPQAVYLSMHAAAAPGPPFMP